MTLEEVEQSFNPFKLAQIYHETYERLSPMYGYKAYVTPWETMWEQKQLLMAAVFAEMIDKGIIEVVKIPRGDCGPQHGE